MEIDRDNFNIRLLLRCAGVALASATAAAPLFQRKVAGAFPAKRTLLLLCRKQDLNASQACRSTNVELTELVIHCL